MSKPPAKTQVLTLNDVSLQVITLSTSSKDGLGPLLSGTLYEALSSTLVDIEESPSSSATPLVVLTPNQPDSKEKSTNIEVSVPFLSAVAFAGPTWPTTLLLSRLLSYTQVDAKNIQVFSSAVKGLLKVIATKDLAASRVASLECLAALLKTKSILLSDVLRSNDLFDGLFRQIKYHGNTVPLAQARVSLFHCLESLIQGVGFGHAMSTVNECVTKIFKYWAGCTERSLQVRAAAARCLCVWIPYAAASYGAIGVIQALLLKELPFSSSFGHVYGILIFTALKESYSKEAVQPVQNLPPTKPGAPPHDSAGILGYKQYESLEAILEHMQSMWLKNGSAKREYRESLSTALTTFYSHISFQFIEKKLPLILSNLFSLISAPQPKMYPPGELAEAKSSITYIIHAGIIANCTEDGKRLIFKELLTMLEQCLSEDNRNAHQAPQSQPFAVDLSRVSMILAEIHSLFAELGESLAPVTSASGSTIEEVLYRLIEQQQITLTSASHKAVFISPSSSNASPNVDGNVAWLWTGLVLKRYCAVNDQFFISVDKLRSMLPSPVGSAPTHWDPSPAAWAFASTKRLRPTSSAEFGAVLEIAQALIAGPETGPNATINAAAPNAPVPSSWNVAGWILLASLLQRGSGQSAEQDRAFVVSSHLATLQQLWKQELSKRPVSDADITDFALSKLWLLYTLKHFLANFSRLVHESNLTTFTTQCLNTVLKSVTTWQGTNTSPKTERDCSAIDALIVALLQSYTTLATHIFNPPTSMSPRGPAGAAQSSGENTSTFPARSVLQMIAKQLVRPRYSVNNWIMQKFFHIDDESLEFNVSPNAGTFPSSSLLYADLHGCTATISHASSLLWPDWSSALFHTRANRSRNGGSDSCNSMTAAAAAAASSVQSSLIEDGVLYTAPSSQLMCEMTSLFPPLFHQQIESHQSQLLQFLGSCLASHTQHTSPVLSNILVFLLAIAKENAKISGTHQLGSLMASPGIAMQSQPLSKTIVSQLVQLSEPYLASPSATLRQIAANIMAAMMDSYDAGALLNGAKQFHHAIWHALGFNASTPTTQIPQASQSLNQLLKAQHTMEGTMLALGSIHRTVGGIRSRQFMNETVRALGAVVRVTFETKPPTNASNPASSQHVSLHRTALHALWIALDATGLSDTSFASSTLGAMLDGLISDISREWQTITHLGRIIGSLAAIWGPELQGSPSLLRRLQGAIVLLDCVGRMEIEDAPVSYNAASATPLGNDWAPPRSLAPTCLAFSASIALRERLLLFAPQFIDSKRSSAKLLVYVRSIRRNTDFDDGSSDSALLSPVSHMRLNALRVLRFLAQLNPQAFQDDIFVRDIVLSPDREPLDSSVRSALRVLISTLEETLVPLDPIKWLAYASHFVMGAESDIKLEFPSTPLDGVQSTSTASSSSNPAGKAGASAKQAPGADSKSDPKKKLQQGGAFGGGNDDNDEEEGMDEAEEEMAGINALSAPVIERVSGAEDESIWMLSSSLAALFVSSLHYMFEPLKSQPAHFEPSLAAQQRALAAQKGSPAPTFLVDSLPSIVALASKASSAPMASLQIAGLESVHDILQCFAKATDPQLEGHFLLELYVAQMSAALRRCISRDSPVANRVCYASYVVLAEMILWIAKHISDVAGLRQLVRPFLDPYLERRPLHAQSIGQQKLTDSMTGDADADSPIMLELNPRYVAWLMSSALLWDGSNALDSLPPSQSSSSSSEEKETQQENAGEFSDIPGIAYLQESARDPKLRRSLCRGWLTILEYRAVQQYSQDLTQLTIFGSSSIQGGAAKRDILANAVTLGVNWCHVLIAMCSQFAEHTWASLITKKGDPSAMIATRSDLSRSGHILFGLILHNLASVSHISATLKALQLLMRGLVQLEAHDDDTKAEEKFARNLLPLPAAAISELCQALANLLGVIHYRDYVQKAQLLDAMADTVVYIATNRLYSTDPSAPLPPITQSFFKSEIGDSANVVVLRDILLESLEHGAKFEPSLRHTIPYLASVLQAIRTTWPLLNATGEQNSRLAMWLANVARIDQSPDLPLAAVQVQLVPLVLDCWQVVASTSLTMCASLVQFALERVRVLKEEGNWNQEKSLLEARFWSSALIRCASSALDIKSESNQSQEDRESDKNDGGDETIEEDEASGKNEPSPSTVQQRASDLANLALYQVSGGELAQYGRGISTLRVFIQKGLSTQSASSGEHESSASVLSALVPVLFERYLSYNAKFNPLEPTGYEMEIRQELLKITILLQQTISSGQLIPNSNDSTGDKEENSQRTTEGIALVLTSLIRLLSPQPLPANAPYVAVHDSGLTVLLHLANTQPVQFKAAFALVEPAERAIFESAVRTRMERQQALQAAQAAPKMKFSLDTSQYAK